MIEYKELHTLDLTEYLQHGIKTTNVTCPKCKSEANVCHRMPFDYRKVCTKCEITWMEDAF